MSRHNGINCIKEVNTEVSEHFPRMLSQFVQNLSDKQINKIVFKCNNSNIWIWKHLSDSNKLTNQMKQFHKFVT